MSKDLTEFNFPEDLKDMDIEQLNLLTYSIRDFLIGKIAKTGGHLASNLGVVELTVAMLKFFDTPTDKIIWDVGHQSYVYKMLTGRIKRFDTLRMLDGLSGFPKCNESVFDAFDTGHSSTSISVASGIAAARDLKGENYNVVAVIGDGSLTGGMAYEALNNLGASKSKVTVVLNDNGMSISKNIGGVSQHLGTLRSSNEYIKTKKVVKAMLNKIPLVGSGLSTGIGNVKDRIKYAVISGGVMFENLGFTYFGPVDGHNIQSMLDVFEQTQHVDGPVLIHVITKKGKGYRTAELEPNKFHGIGVFDPETGVELKKQELSYSDVFGEVICEEGDKDPNIVAITAAMGVATGLKAFSLKHPKRYFDVGIAEAHAVTFAAGLAKSGMKPVVAIYSSFLQRAYDQILEDVCIQNLPVVFAIDRAGIVGADGETHHGLFDLSFLSSLPNMKILTPANGNQLREMMKYALELNSPVAIRYPRGQCIINDKTNINFEGRNIRVLPEGKVDIWGCGKMLEIATDVQKLLVSRGISAGVVDVTTVKPMDLSLIGETSVIVTIEDNVLLGGFGEKLKALLPNREVVSFGWPDKFIEHGTPQQLFHRYGLDAETIAERISEYLERKA